MKISITMHIHSFNELMTITILVTVKGKYSSNKAISKYTIKHIEANYCIVNLKKTTANILDTILVLILWVMTSIRINEGS